MAGWGRRIVMGMALLITVAGVLRLAGLVPDFWIIPLFLAFLAFILLIWVLPSILVIGAGERMLRRRAPGLRWLVPVAVGAVFLAFVISSYWRIQQQARLAADQSLIGTVRSAALAYYRAHGRYPEHLGGLTPSPPIFQCAALRYTYSPTTGEIRITSTNTFDDCW